MVNPWDWRPEFRERYRRAKRLLITADGGGSNGSRVRLWKLELQKLADELGVHGEWNYTINPESARYGAIIPGRGLR
jgi:hypothetical protein